jgi:hypothetical protein
MSSTPTETLVARCLMEPQHLDSLIAAQKNPAALRELKRLRLFGAFISKVQHNNLWDAFPGTTRLMQYLGIELRLFAAYRAKHFTGKLPKLHREDKVRLFVHFLEETLPTKRYRKFWVLADVFRHEKNLWELSVETPLSVPLEEGDEDVASQSERFSTMKWNAFQRLAPRWEGSFRVERFDCNPVRLVEKLRRSLENHSFPRRGTYALGYWRSMRGIAQVLRLDTYQGAILSRINGKRRVRTIIADVRGGGLRMASPLQFRSFFEEAAGARFISLS